MGRLYANTPETFKADRDKHTAAFESLMDQYNDRLADQYDTPEPVAAPVAAPATVRAAPVAAAPAVAPAAPTMHDPLLGSGVTAAALKSDGPYGEMSYQGRRALADKALEQAKAALLAAKTPDASISTTLSNMRKEYAAALGPAPDRSVGRLALDTSQRFTTGVWGALKSVTDLGGTDNPLSTVLRDEIEYLKTKLSPKALDEVKHEAEERAALGKTASGWQKAGLAIKQSVADPLGAGAELVGGIAPLGGAAKLGVKGMAALGAAMGGGGVKGAIRDSVMGAEESDLMADPEYAKLRSEWSEATARDKFATRQQSFGQSWGKTLIGAGVGAAGMVLSPVAKTLVASAALKGATPEAIALITKEAAQKTLKGGVLRAAAVEGSQQAGINAVQGGVTSALGTAGANSSGATTPYNVAEALGSGLVPGFVAGAGFGVHGRGIAREQAQRVLDYHTNAAAEAAKLLAADAPPPPAGTTPGAPPAGKPATPGNASAFEKIYAEHGVDMTQPYEDLLVAVKQADGKFKPTPLKDIDPAHLQEVVGGTPLSDMFTGARDIDAGALKEAATKAAAPTSETIDTTPPYADVPGPVVAPVESAEIQQSAMLVGYYTRQLDPATSPPLSATLAKSFTESLAREQATLARLRALDPKPTETTTAPNEQTVEPAGVAQAPVKQATEAVAPPAAALDPASPEALNANLKAALAKQNATQQAVDDAAKQQAAYVAAGKAAPSLSPSDLHQTVTAALAHQTEQAQAAHQAAQRSTQVALDAATAVRPTTESVAPPRALVRPSPKPAQVETRLPTNLSQVHTVTPPPELAPAVRTATESTVAPRALTRAGAKLEQVETRKAPAPSEVFTTGPDGRPRTVKDQATAQERRREQTGQLSARGDSYVDGDGRPVTAEEHTAITQAIDSVTALDAKLSNPTAEPVAKPAKATKLAPASKKKVSDGEVNADTRTSADTQGREGQAAPVEGAGNTETVAGQKAGATAGVGDDLQQPAGAGRKAEASTGRSGTSTEGTEQGVIARSEQSKSRLGKPVKPSDAERTAAAVTAWDEAGVNPQFAVPYDSLGPIAKKNWTDTVSLKMDPDAKKAHLKEEATRLSRDAQAIANSKKNAKKVEAENARGERDVEGERKTRVEAQDRVPEVDEGGGSGAVSKGQDTPPIVHYTSISETRGNGEYKNAGLFYQVHFKSGYDHDLYALTKEKNPRPLAEAIAARSNRSVEQVLRDAQEVKRVVAENAEATSGGPKNDPTVFPVERVITSVESGAVQPGRGPTPSIALAKLNRERRARASLLEDSTLERAKTLNGETDHPEVREAAKTGNADTLLDAVSKTDLTPDQRAMVDALRGKLDGVRVVHDESATDPSYDPKTKVLTTINGSAESALHELVHAGTIEAIYAAHGGRGTPVQRAAVQELAQLQRIIQVEHRLDNVSAFDADSYSHLSTAEQPAVRAAEIVAEVQANPKAARALARITGSGKAMTGVQRFVAAVRDLLGMKPSADSALAKVLRLTEPLLKSEPGPNALVNSGFELGTLNRVSTRAKGTDESWPDYAKRRGLAFGESSWVADNLKKRPNESWGDYIARKTTVFYKPVTAAEEGHTVYSKDGKYLDGFTNAAEAKALQAQHPGSRIDTTASIFSGEKSIGGFMETMRNKIDARVSADGDTYVKPLEVKLGAYYKELGGNIRDAHADLNTAANALSVIGANEVGRRVHTELTDIANAKRTALDHQVKTGQIAPSTAWRAMKVLVDNPANRALDAAGNPGHIRENFGGFSDAEARKILAAHPAAEKFLTVTAKPELDAIRTRLRALDVDSLQYDARAGGIIDMYSDKHHFPLFGKEGGPLVDVPRGLSSTESGTLHAREGRDGAAHVPLDTLVDTLTTANQRIVERDRSALLNKMFFAAHNPNSPDHAKAKYWFEQAGIKYVKSDVLDATDQAKNANQATQGSSKTIVTRRLIAGGKGKIQQIHFTVDDSVDNGQRGANFITAWSGAHIAEPGIALRAMTVAQRAFTSTLTRLNPLFAPVDWYRTQKMVGSLVAGDFGVSVGGKFLSKMAETNPGAIAKALTGAADANPTIVRVLAEMREMGALTTYSGSYGLKNVAVRLQGSQRLGSARDKVTHSIDMYNEAFEWSPRVAAYMTLREHGLSPTDAGLWALKVANFSAGGEWTPIIRAFVPFYNPGIQGIRRMADVVQQVKTGNTRMAGVLAVRALTAAMLYAMNNAFVGKDEEGKDIYAKMSGSKHYRNNYIPNPMGEGLIALPRPIDMGPVDGIGVAVARLMLGHTTIDQALGEYAQDGAQRLSPVEVKDYHSLGANILAAMSGVLRPLVEIGMNETGLGTPISRDHKREHKLAAFNGRENTPQVYKDVAAMLGDHLSSIGGENVSPEDVRHVFKSYGGWFAAGLDNIANKADDNQAPVSAAKLTPFVGRFLEDKPTSDARYYDLNKSAQYLHDKFNSMGEDKRSAAREADPKAAATADLWAESYKADMALAKEAKAMSRTPAEKKAEVLEKRNRIHDDFIRRYREINK